MVTFLIMAQRNALPIQTQEESMRLQTLSSMIWLRMQMVVLDWDINEYSLSIINIKTLLQFQKSKFNQYLTILPLDYNIQLNMDCTVCHQPIYRLCFSQRCHYPAQFCDNKLCHTYQRHVKCPSVIYEQYSKLEKDIQKNQKQFVAKVNILLSEFIEQINFSRTQKIRRRHHQKLGNLFKKLNKARRNRDSHFVSGKEVKQAIEQVDHLGQDSAPAHFQRNFKELARILESFKNKIIEEKERYFQKMMDEGQQSNQQSSPFVQEFIPFPTNQINQSMVNNIDEASPQILQISPQIKKERGRPKVVIPKKSQEQISDFLSSQDKQFIKTSFNGKEVTAINKIYTASARENQYSPQMFYSKCGQLSNTLVVARYKYKNQPQNQINYFAGFTPLQWGNKDYPPRSFQSDYSNLSKLFWVNQKMVFPIKTEQTQNNAIYIDKQFGLYFGRDLIIKFKKDGTNVNTIDIGKKYQNGHLIFQTQYSKLRQYQSKINYQGRIHDYQVYQVEFKQ